MSGLDSGSAAMSRHKPRCLDIFCKAGGSSWGYHLAGFEVWGVDWEAQPRFPFRDRFIQTDALEYLHSADLGSFDLLAASPPCQRYSSATPVWARENHSDLIAPVREALIRSGKPWVIENVPGAPLVNAIMLCGIMFGLRVFRHRFFETSSLVLAPSHESHGSVRMGQDGYCTITSGGCWRPLATRSPRLGENGFCSVSGHGPHSGERRRAGVRIGVDGFVTIAGGGNSGMGDRSGGGSIRHRPEDGVVAWRRAMEIDWMTRDELAQAVPPAYTKFLGEQIIERL